LSADSRLDLELDGEVVEVVGVEVEPVGLQDAEL
jgi:hypothetical protein